MSAERRKTSYFADGIGLAGRLLSAEIRKKQVTDDVTGLARAGCQRKSEKSKFPMTWPDLSGPDVNENKEKASSR
jgi:hypothetical protein